MTPDENHALTVHELAEFLQVPISWAHERIRTELTDRIPGIRLGKYWQLREMDINLWLGRRRTKDYSDACESE
jgi:hypothetical protein